MNKKPSLKRQLILALLSFGLVTLQSQVTLSADFTDEDTQGEPLHNIWSVGNRISPTGGSNLRSDLEINLVRMVGGVITKKNGERVPNLAYDPCHYDSDNNVYVYNWEPFISRLNKIVESQSDILQIVLDQPPWAFQHGYTFIPDGECDSIHFRESERISIYGNSLPPADKEAYHDFIKALMTKLVETYGEEKVLSWRFRVGSEIETPDHWFGTKADFVAHYANTERAVRAVLPNAKVGVHTRPPGFVYKRSNRTNYKGEPFASFIDDLIEYCHDTDVSYDFWGISDYVIISRPDFRMMDQKFEELFGELVNHPKWNKDATLDLMEYATITSMNALGNGFVNCATSHKEVVELAFSNQFYKNQAHGIEYIYRWGNREGSTDPVAISVLNTMVGMTYYKHTDLGIMALSDNDVDAIFTKDSASHAYDVLIYSFNAQTLDYQTPESVTVSVRTDLPVGTTMYCRSLTYGKANNKLQCFLENEPETGWVKEGYSRRGDASRILNKEGRRAYRKYENPNPHQFGAWHEVTTTACPAGKSGSLIEVDAELPSFAFEKFEFRMTVE